MSNDKQQTAVDWLYQHLFPKQLDGFSEEEWSKIDVAFQQAKEMEKEQKEETWVKAIDYSIMVLKDKTSKTSKEAFDEHYELTYGGNK